LGRAEKEGGRGRKQAAGRLRAEIQGEGGRENKYFSNSIFKPLLNQFSRKFENPFFLKFKTTTHTK
jgi:hypothetical protein